MSLNHAIRHHSRFLFRVIDQLSHRLLPPSCILCGYATHRRQNICAPCQHDLPILTHHCCQCAQFLTAIDHSTPLCGTCLTTPPPFDQTLALYPYEPPIIQLIIALKFQHQLSHAHAFGHLLAEQIESRWYQHQPLPDVIIPVPLHPTRLKERGFNQALEIARPIASRLSLPIDRNGLIRIKPTAAQSGLSADARKENMVNAFRANRDYTGLSVAVLDDVITTGQTIQACCHALKMQGAKRIHVWCCARRG